MNKLLLITSLSLLVNACTIPSDFSYKADIYQGSVLNRIDINQLKIGMSKHQVRDIIGYPSIIDPFHKNQWNYINHSSLNSRKVINYRLTLTFEQEKLTDINTDGIGSLPALRFIEKVAENNRINNEKAAMKTKIVAMKLAKEKAKIAKIKAKRIAIAQERKKAEKAQALAIKIAQEKNKNRESNKRKGQNSNDKTVTIKQDKEKIKEIKKTKIKTKYLVQEKTRALKEKQKQEKSKP